jgi:CelD/BcsL family acetyltransferase involved in cellulose biosynthesis
MRVHTIPASALEPGHVHAWCELQAADPALSSPFLAPEFMLAVAHERPDVVVGLVEEGGRPVGFFPHQRGRFGTGRPVGGTLNDLQGIVAAPGVDIAAADLIRGCGLLHWQFSRVIASQAPFAPYHVRADVSRFIDLSGGFDAYARAKHDAFGERLLRKGRKLEREAGPVRFELQSADSSALAQLMAWKRDRYRRAGYVDVFKSRWARRVIERIHATQTARFAGLLSLLWAGDRIAAAHLGIRCMDRCHSWAVAYAPEFARYSPGLLLYWKLAESAASAGVLRIEIGGGHYPYKNTLANTSMRVAGGSVDRVALVTVARRWSEERKEWIRGSSVLRPPARMFLRTYRRMLRSAVK